MCAGGGADSAWGYDFDIGQPGPADSTPNGSGSVQSSGAARFSGHVSYCAYRDYGYFVGIRFSDETKWSSGVFEPQHLTNLASLSERTIRRSVEECLRWVNVKTSEQNMTRRLHRRDWNAIVQGLEQARIISGTLFRNCDAKT